MNCIPDLALIAAVKTSAFTSFVVAGFFGFLVLALLGLALFLFRLDKAQKKAAIEEGKWHTSDPTFLFPTSGAILCLAISGANVVNGMDDYLSPEIRANRHAVCIPTHQFSVQQEVNK